MFAPLGWLKRPIHREIYRVISASSYFDAQWYRSNHMGLMSRLGDPVWHYLSSWSTRATDPSANFDTSYYVESYPDVRASGINPLFHYEKYGRAEQRSTVRSGQEIIAHYLPFTSELATVPVAAHPTARTSIVIDPNTPLDSPKWVRPLRELITVSNNPVRLIVRGGDSSGGLSSTVNSLLGPIAGQASIVEIPGNGPYSDLPRLPGERFIATSWSSARSLLPLARVTPVDEARLATSGGLELRPATQDLVEDATLLALMPAASNRQQAREQLSSLSTSPQPRSIAVYCDPANSPLGFLRSIEFLETFLLEQPANAALPDIYLWGAAIEPLSLWGSLVPVQTTAGTLTPIAERTDVSVVLTENPIPQAAREIVARFRGLTVTSQDLKSAATVQLGLSQDDVAKAATELATS
jgi:hypothetical protein